MPKKGTIVEMPKKETVLRHLICPHCKITNHVEVLPGATVFLFCYSCGTKMKWFEENGPLVDKETSGEIIKLPPPKDEPERSEETLRKQLKAVSNKKPKEPEIKWA